MLEKITPLILTYNEEPNLEKTLERLKWAKEIIVIDSYSTDQTLEILAKYPQIKIFQRKFDTFANQCNYGLTKINSEWVLSLDADYILSQEFIEEIKNLSENEDINSYITKFKYCIHGHPLRGTLYPPRKVLYRKSLAKYEDDGHAHRVKISGKSLMLSSYIYHDDRKSLSHWLASQDRYLLIEAKKITETPLEQLSFGDKIRKKKYLAPLIILIYCLIIKGGILDGWAGWYYAFQRMVAEIILSLRLMEIEQQ